MMIENLDHFTLRVAENMLPVLLDFYTRVLQLRDGDRPAFSFAGHWLYAGENAVGRLETQKPRRTGLLTVLLDFLELLKTCSWRRIGDSNPG